MDLDLKPSLTLMSGGTLDEECNCSHPWHLRVLMEPTSQGSHGMCTACGTQIMLSPQTCLTRSVSETRIMSLSPGASLTYHSAKFTQFPDGQRIKPMY